MQNLRTMLFVVTPWPPSTSGVGDVAFSQVILLVQAGFAVTVVTPIAKPVPLRNVLIITPEEAQALPAFHAGRVIYHLGNHLASHRFMMPLMERKPGIVVLHDLALVDLVVGLFLPYSPGGMHALAAETYGVPAADKLMLLAVSNALFVNRDLFLDFPFYEPFLKNALGVAVYSAFAKTAVAKRICNMPLVQLPMWFADFSYPQIERFKAEREPSEVVRMASFGHLGYFKLPFVIIEVLLRLTDVPNWTFDFIGPVDRQLEMELRQRIPVELRDRVRLIGEVGEAELFARMTSADLAVQLRWPTMGETSAIVRRCLQLGVPIIVSEIGAMQEVPPHVLRVPGENCTVVLEATLTRFLTDRTFRQHCDKGARAFMKSVELGDAVAGLTQLSNEVSWSRISGDMPVQRILSDYYPNPAWSSSKPSPLSDKMEAGRKELLTVFFSQPVFVDHPVLSDVNGWHTAEPGPKVWVTGESSVGIAVDANRDLYLDLECPRQNTLTVRLGDRSFVLDVWPGRKLYRIPTASAQGFAGTMSITASHTWCLSDLYGGDDRRWGAFCLFQIKTAESGVDDSGTGIVEAGLYGPEYDPDQQQMFRWTSGNAVFHLTGRGRCSLVFGAPLVEMQVGLTIDGVSSEHQLSPGEVRQESFSLDAPIGRPVEISIETDGVIPSAVGRGMDDRILGVRVYAMELVRE